MNKLLVDQAIVANGMIRKIVSGLKSSKAHGRIAFRGPGHWNALPNDVENIKKSVF